MRILSGAMNQNSSNHECRQNSDSSSVIHHTTNTLQGKKGRGVTASSKILSF